MTPTNHIRSVVPEFNPQLMVTVVIESGYNTLLTAYKDEIKQLGGHVEMGEDGPIEITLGIRRDSPPSGRKEAFAFLKQLHKILPPIVFEEVEVAYSDSAPQAQAILDRLEVNRRDFGTPKVSEKTKEIRDLMQFAGFVDHTEMNRALPNGLTSKYYWNMDEYDGDRITVIGKCAWHKHKNTSPLDETQLQRMVNYTTGMARQVERDLTGQTQTRVERS